MNDFKGVHTHIG